MGTMLSWLKYNRPDVVWVKGPDQNGNYSWDKSLPDQQQIADLIADFNPDWTPPTLVPESITSRQMRLMLLSIGIGKELVEGIINGLPEPQRSFTMIEWEYATEYERHHPMIDGLGVQLGLTSEQIDQMFIQGSQL